MPRSSYISPDLKHKLPHPTRGGHRRVSSAVRTRFPSSGCEVAGRDGGAAPTLMTRAPEEIIDERWALGAQRLFCHHTLTSANQHNHGWTQTVFHNCRIAALWSAMRVNLKGAFEHEESMIRIQGYNSWALPFCPVKNRRRDPVVSLGDVDATLRSGRRIPILRLSGHLETSSMRTCSLNLRDRCISANILSNVRGTVSTASSSWITTP